MKNILRTIGSTTLLALGLGFLIAASGRGSQALRASSPEKPASGVEVRIDNFTFAPRAVKVSVGTTVTWVNRDDIPHTVVSEAKAFKSKVLDTDEAFSYAFTKVGRYPYFCSLHPKMTGEVVVQ
ncbi:MAG TPA: cupredoxin family copper-binding protein [Thermoanaerobaculia bacterium]|nr:cupredoxin family copper-binding protein [Thermoanaerobaculia bacterium]